MPATVPATVPATGCSQVSMLVQLADSGTYTAVSLAASGLSCVCLSGVGRCGVCLSCVCLSAVATTRERHTLMCMRQERHTLLCMSLCRSNSAPCLPLHRIPPLPCLSHTHAHTRTHTHTHTYTHISRERGDPPDTKEHDIK